MRLDEKNKSGRCVMNTYDKHPHALLEGAHGVNWGQYQSPSMLESFQESYEKLRQLIQGLFAQSEKETLRTAKEMILLLDRYERDSGALASDVLAEVGSLVPSIKDLLDHLAAFHSKAAVVQKQQLTRRYIALQYRLGLAHPAAVKADVYNRLKATAAEWKQKMINLPSQILLEKDMHQLETVASYELFTELVAEDKELAERFFDWTLQDHLQAEVFILYPALHQLIIDNKLNGRLGRFNESMLAVREDNGEKRLSIKVEGRWVPMDDPELKVSFRGGYSLTLSEILNVFKEKDLRVGNLEVLAHGITNWNCHKLGYYDARNDTYVAVDLNQSGWWKQLPETEILTIEEAAERYESRLDGEMWVLAARATRKRQTLDPDESHAFLEVAVPDNKNRYHVYTFGKFAINYTTNMIETAMAFTDNLEATIAYPDENIFYSDRQHATYGFTVTPEEGVRAMNAIKADMIESMEGQFMYQWESENCAKWVQDKLEAFVGRHRVPNLFQIPMLETEPSGPSRFLFSALKLLPKQFHSPALSILHYPLGAWRSRQIRKGNRMEVKSLTNTFFWDDKIVYLPARLYEKERLDSYRFLQSSWDETAELQPEMVLATRGSLNNG